MKDKDQIGRKYLQRKKRQSINFQNIQTAHGVIYIYIYIYIYIIQLKNGQKT